MESPKPARVINVGRNHAWISFDDERTARRAELRKTQEREMLVPGDRVTATLRSDGVAFVESREERRTVLDRLTPGGRRKVMAANIDTLVIASAFARPTPNPVMLDEILAFAECHALEAMLLFSKADLAPAEEVEALTQLYLGIGYRVFLVDARVEVGVPGVAEALAEHDSLLVGPSGVGKSTLFRALGGEGAVGEVSDKTGRGKQTTTSGRLHRFAIGTLIDSPGIGEFALEGIEPSELANYFKEFRPYLGGCRFIDCRHDKEPGCRLSAALAEGRITTSRYFSFRRAYDRLEAENARRFDA